MVCSALSVHFCSKDEGSSLPLHSDLRILKYRILKYNRLIAKQKKAFTSKVTYVTDSVPSLQPLLAAPPHCSEQRSLLAAPPHCQGCPPPPASAGLRLAMVCRPAPASLTPLSIIIPCAVCARALVPASCPCIVWTAVTSKPFLLHHPSHHNSSQSQPRSSALPVAATLDQGDGPHCILGNSGFLQIIGGFSALDT